MEEQEDKPFLTTSEEIELFEKYPHSLDYKFTDEQKRFLDENGYLVIENLIPEHLCDAMVEECEERMKALYGADVKDPNTWQIFRENRGFMNIWHAHNFYQMRQYPMLYSVFAQLLKEPKLTVSLDRVCFKPPKDDKAGLAIHTDMNLWYIDELAYQGGIALCDTDVSSGGFKCIPGYHKLEKIVQYRNRYESGLFDVKDKYNAPPSKDQTFLFYKDQEAIQKAIEVPMKKGDLVIWSNRLPHGSCPNPSEFWRKQCFIRYVPTFNSHKYTKMVSDCAQQGKIPEYFSTGSKTNLERTGKEYKSHNLHGLSPLGKKLLGLSKWEWL